MAKGDMFKPGDFVQLKSGGPKMTVSRLNVDAYECKWFVGSKLNEAEFEEGELQPYVEPEKK